MYEPSTLRIDPRVADSRDAITRTETKKKWRRPVSGKRRGVEFKILIWARVARWYNFNPKTPIWVNFGGLLNGQCYFTALWCSLWPFGNVVVILYIFPSFGILCQEKSGKPDLGSICLIDKFSAKF
jgi:hypothetical protein